MKLVSSLIDSVNVFMSSEVSEFGVSGAVDTGLGSSDVSISGPHVSMSVAINSCLKSSWAIPILRVIRVCLFSVATFSAWRISLFCLIACPDSDSWHECNDPLNREGTFVGSCPSDIAHSFNVSMIFSRMILTQCGFSSVRVSSANRSSMVSRDRE